MVLPVRRVPTAEEIVWLPVREAFENANPTFLVTPARFAPEMKVRRNAEEFAASVTETPALFYSRGGHTTERMTSTSLCGEWRYLDDDKIFVPFPADFVRWGKKVMQWVVG